MTIVYGTMSSKGGAGKTTLATLIAGEYAVAGKMVLLVDADPSQDLHAWWNLSGQKALQPENIDFVSALTVSVLENIMAQHKSDYDVIIVDTAGRDPIMLTEILNYADIMLTPIQPAKREIDATHAAAEIIAEFNDESSRQIIHLIVRTRIKLTDRHSDTYRFIRPFVEHLRTVGEMPATHLLNAELYERNVYHEIAIGYGTVQMQELSETVKKARLEIMALLHEIESHIPANKQEAA